MVIQAAALAWLLAGTATPGGPATPASSARPATSTVPDTGAEVSASAPQPSLYGASGLLRVLSGDAGPAGTLRLSFSGAYLRATQFLAQSPYDTDRRWTGRLALAYSPLRWLELSLLADASGNDNSRGKPSVSYTSDVYLGLKLGWAMGRLLHLGLHGAAVILAGTGDLPFSSRSTSLLARAIATLDLRGLASSFPLRIHLNVGGIMDNSDVLVQPAFDSIERYALRLNQANRVLVGLGLEAPVSPRVAPFAEWSLEAPVGALPATSHDHGFDAYPNILSLGARLFPWRGLVLSAAMDVGLTSQGRLGVPAVPPWQLHFGVGWSFEPARAAAAPAPRPSAPEDDF